MCILTAFIILNIHSIDDTRGKYEEGKNGEKTYHNWTHCIGHRKPFIQPHWQLTHTVNILQNGNVIHGRFFRIDHWAIPLFQFLHVLIKVFHTKCKASGSSVTLCMPLFNFSWWICSSFNKTDAFMYAHCDSNLWSWKTSNHELIKPFANSLDGSVNIR